MSGDVMLHPTDSARADAFVQQHLGGLLSPPSSAAEARLLEIGPLQEHLFEVNNAVTTYRPRLMYYTWYTVLYFTLLMVHVNLLYNVLLLLHTGERELLGAGGGGYSDRWVRVGVRHWDWTGQDKGICPCRC